jgi:hypothetical protein
MDEGKTAGLRSKTSLLYGHLKSMVCAVALGTLLSAQPKVPSKAGMVTYGEGQIYIDDRVIAVPLAQSLMVGENSVLHTGIGGAEVLLGPCAAMWIGKDSSVRLISSALADARIELLTGSVVVASRSLPKGAKLTLLMATVIAPIDSRGAYRFDAQPPEIKVLSGRIAVRRAEKKISVGGGRLLDLDPQPKVRKFDMHVADPLEDWSRERAIALGRDLNPHAVTATAPVVHEYPRRTWHGTAKPSSPIPPLPNSDDFGCGVRGQ